MAERAEEMEIPLTDIQRGCPLAGCRGRGPVERRTV